MIPKFKAYCKFNKTIYEVLLIDFKAKIEQIKLRKTGNIWYDFEDVVLMQSTGLHDKHGVEIFEWDILTSQDGTDGLISRFIVKRDEFYTGFIPMNREGYGFNRTMCEVIGNVCKHHELLDDV